MYLFTRNDGSQTVKKTRVFVRIPDWAILACFCAIFSLQLLWPLSQQSATFDEPGNLVSGYVSLRFGDDRLIPQNLPLVKLLAAAPLLLSQDLALPPPPKPWSAEAQYRYASRFLYGVNDADTLLLLGRLAVLPLSLALGCGVFLWAKQLFGGIAATFAVLLYCFEPNVLAHSGLITTDIATSCFMFWTLFGWYHMMQIVTWPRVGLTGLAFGLALLSKFTALSLFPILLLMGGLMAFTCQPFRIQLKGFSPRTVESRGWKLLVICLLVLGTGILASVVIWAGYCFHYTSAVIPVATYQAPWEHSLPASPSLHTLLVSAREAKLLPEAYLYGLSHQLKVGGTAESYLMGDIRPWGWWYYFLVTFAIKTPVPLLLFLVLSILTNRNYWRNNPLGTACLMGPIVVYFTMISASGWNIGHRHLLPIYPPLFILAGALASWAIRQAALVRLGLVVLVCWYILSSASVFPHYLAYFNELIGGPDNGHRYLVDSNLDWGQDLKGLKRYMDEQGIDRIWLSYFGQASPDYHGIRYSYLPSYDIFDPKNVDPNVFLMSQLPPLPGTVAISATLLQGAMLSAIYHLSPAYFEYYRQQTPVARIGHSIFIYRVE
jgi:hypothetical protein